MKEVFIFMNEYMTDMGYTDARELYSTPFGEFAAYYAGRMHDAVVAAVEASEEPYEPVDNFNWPDSMYEDVENDD